MINMEPVIKRGYTFWDQSLFPVDEYFERVRSVQGAMDKAGLDALLVFSSNYDSGDLSYLAGGAGGTLVLPREGEPSLITGGGGRELPFQRTLTWIGDVSSAAGGVPARVQQALQSRGISGGRIGVVGSRHLTEANFEAFAKSLPSFELLDFNEQLRAIRASKRPREVTAVRIALGMALRAGEAAEKAFSEGASTTRAIIEAERSARLERSRDLRVLANIDSDDLRPFEGLSDAARTPLLMWLGLNYCGYWADLAFTFPAPPRSDASQAVDAMARAARAGATAGEVAEAGVASLPAAARETALSYGLGGGIGLALQEWPSITPGNQDTLVEGALLSLRAFARHDGRVSFANAVVQVGREGATRLTPL